MPCRLFPQPPYTPNQSTIGGKKNPIGSNFEILEIDGMPDEATCIISASIIHPGIFMYHQRNFAFDVGKTYRRMLNHFSNSGPL